MNCLVYPKRKILPSLTAILLLDMPRRLVDKMGGLPFSEDKGKKGEGMKREGLEEEQERKL